MENETEPVSTEALKAAFKPEKKSKKTLISIIVLIIGAVTLVIGLVFLILNLNRAPGLQDGEYLVSAKEWVLVSGTECVTPETESECPPSVLWQFTEIGKGTLTTNNHLNDYDFIWALEDGKLKIETAWLYTLNDEYDYELKQNTGELVLKNGEQEFVLRASFESE